LLRDVEVAPAIASSPTLLSAVDLPQPLDASDIHGLSASDAVAGAPVGSTQVYKNEINQVANVYGPGANQRMADDLTLANGSCNAVYYNLVVYGVGTVGTFNVHTELWTGNPCLPASTVIAGTAHDFAGAQAVPNNQTLQLLEVPIGPGVSIPPTVWLAVTFSGVAAADATWVFAGRAEVGSTADVFSENDTDASPDVCELFWFGGIPYAGFWANVYCETVVPPNGACCNGTTCTQTTEAACVSPGVWQGAFTTCQPNACLTGACCTGVDFEDCAETNEPGCVDGLFRPGTVCLDNPCGQSFEVYENDFATGIFVPIETGRKWGDDLTMGAGAPCPLVAYEVLMAGDSPPATFNAHVELWSNNDRGTPTVDADDMPLAVIPGTQRDFNGLAADLTLQRLLVGPFSALQLPKKVWMVVTTNSANAGPIFGGLADIGFSQDGFRIYNHPSAPNAWSADVFAFGGFNGTNCPYDPNNPTCNPAGSFRAIVWCAGAPPTGACCNDLNGTCADGVESMACEGRWKQDVTCDSNPFNPPCGTHACCFPNPINPNAVVCQDLTPEDCIASEGSSAPGLFCVDVTCPIVACINRAGSCFGAHGTTGCENAFCCEKVCAADPSCCSTDWDSICVDRARDLCSWDQCADAMPISGAGVFSFDTTTATTDGPIHADCATMGGPEKQIQKDVWHCWTAPCTDTVFVRTCGQTTVNTKLAVYEGCDCPPTDAVLLDCGDDRCGDGLPQATAVFHAVAGRSYLIRLGNYPGTAPGTGSFTISCGPPNQPNCGGAGGCCTAEDPTVLGCIDEACCERVCGCDAYCCDAEWDESCATGGFQNNGCGADVLCPALCGNCPAGTVTFNSPPPGILDAARPFPPGDATALLGIDTIQVTAPPGANQLGCWSVCETASNGPANGIADITDNGGGLFTIKLARPITPGAVTKLTYKGNSPYDFVRYFAHPANLNLDGFANVSDVDALVTALKGGTPLPGGLLSGDVNRSGATSGADVLDAVGLLIGEGHYTIWNNTAKPVPNANCP